MVTIRALAHGSLHLMGLRITWSKRVENVDFRPGPHAYLGRVCWGEDWKKGRPVNKRQMVC